jgi:hypothetical protein
MRIIINFNELYDAVGKVAAEYGETYWHVEIAKCSSGVYDEGHLRQGLVLSGYINGFRKWVRGYSIDEVVTKLRELKNSSASNLEVEVELEDAIDTTIALESAKL